MSIVNVVPFQTTIKLKREDWGTWDIIITLAPTSFTAPKIAWAVPGTPAIPVLGKMRNEEELEGML